MFAFRFGLSMFYVKNMSSVDVGFAVRITDEVKWNLDEADFRFMMEIEPRGCFVLYYDSKRVGIATAVCFGRIGWLGNVIVDENHREKGGGSLLVNRAIKFLMDSGAEAVGLYAYVDTIAFYKRLEFGYDSEFVVLEGLGFSSEIESNISKVQRQHIQQIIDFDSYFLGMSRDKLLEHVLLDSSNTSHFCIEREEISGYAASKVFEETAELGPLVCKKGQNKIAADLVRANLNDLEGLKVTICLPKKETKLICMLSKEGFEEKFCVARMFYGSATTSDCIYVAESLERG